MHGKGLPHLFFPHRTRKTLSHCVIRLFANLISVYALDLNILASTLRISLCKMGCSFNDLKVLQTVSGRSSNNALGAICFFGPFRFCWELCRLEDRRHAHWCIRVSASVCLRQFVPGKGCVLSAADHMLMKYRYVCLRPFSSWSNAIRILRYSFLFFQNYTRLLFIFVVVSDKIVCSRLACSAQVKWESYFFQLWASHSSYFNHLLPTSVPVLACSAQIRLESHIMMPCPVLLNDEFRSFVTDLCAFSLSFYARLQIINSVSLRLSIPLTSVLFLCQQCLWHLWCQKLFGALSITLTPVYFWTQLHIFHAFGFSDTSAFSKQTVCLSYCSHQKYVYQIFNFFQMCASLRSTTVHLWHFWYQ